MKLYSTFCLLICHLVVQSLASQEQAAKVRDFTIENDLFMLDGKPFRILSGRYSTWQARPLMYAQFALLCETIYHTKSCTHLGSVSLCSCSLHYHRIPLAYWEDRMRRIKALGLNTISVSHCLMGQPCQYTSLSVCLHFADQLQQSSTGCVEAAYLPAHA